MKIYRLLLVVIFFIFCACFRYDVSKTTFYLEKVVESLNSGDEIFSEVEFIPLKGNGEFALHKIDKIIINQSFIYLLDRTKNAIYKYDMDGNPVKYFHRIDSLEQNLKPIDFDIDIMNNQIVVLCNSPKLIYTDFDFNIIEKDVYLGNKYFDRMAVWYNNIFLYDHGNKTIERYDQVEDELFDCFEYSTSESILVKSAATFFKISSGLYFQSPSDNYVYKCVYESDDEDFRFLPHLLLDFENKDEVLDFYEDERLQEITFDEKLMYPVPSVKCIFEKNGHLAFVYEYGIMYRIFIYDDVSQKYKDKYLKFFSTNSLHYNNNNLYALDSPVDINMHLNNAYFNDFMKNVNLVCDEKWGYNFPNYILVKHSLK
jgi:hypothetical protein